MQDARVFLSVYGMAFRLFGGKKEQKTEPAVQRRVVIEGYKPPPMPAPKETPVTDPLKQRLLFRGLHEDINPSENVRTSRMTCPSCTHEFRYFVNSDGKKTVVKCPSCAKTFRL